MMPRLPTALRMQLKPAERDWQSRQGIARAWYALPLWRALRYQVLQRDAWICRACGEPAGASAHCDHIVPHAGDWDRFVDEANLQCLCATCHSQKTCTEDGGFGR